MRARVGMKYMLISAETFGSTIATVNGNIWRPEIRIVEFKYYDQSQSEPWGFLRHGKGDREV